MTRQQADIRETARKLRRLTTSPNAHEATRAREKYQAYTAQHQISLEDEPVFPPTKDEAVLATLRRNAEELQRVVRAWQERNAAWAVTARELQAKTERHEIEYLRRLPQAKRDEYLRRLPRAKQAEYRRQFEVLRQASRSKRAEKGGTR